MTRHVVLSVPILCKTDIIFIECKSCLFSEVPLELVKSYVPEHRYVIETEDIYERACLYYRITSSQTYVKQVTTTRAISMANTSLSAGTVKPIAISLVVSGKNRHTSIELLRH